MLKRLQKRRKKSQQRKRTDSQALRPCSSSQGLSQQCQREDLSLSRSWSETLELANWFQPCLDQQDLQERQPLELPLK